MNNIKHQIDYFFNEYCNNFNRALNENHADIEQTAKLFADCFIAANPAGVNCGKNDETFRNAMQQGYAFYKSIGITSMEITAKEISPLDEFHTMTKVFWKSGFTRKDGTRGEVAFTNIYFTQTRENQHKVFAYITGDETAALKENGLI